MTLLVCPLSQVEAARALHRPSHLVSLLSPASAAEAWPVAEGLHLRLAFHDIAEPREGFTPPDAALVARLLDFAAGWDATRPMLVHCWAGVSRSMAATYAILCDRLGPGSEIRAAQAIRSRAPHAYPNSLMVQYADDLLERRGHMVAAIKNIGAGMMVAEGTIVEFPLREL